MRTERSLRSDGAAVNAADVGSAEAGSAIGPVASEPVQAHMFTVAGLRRSASSLTNLDQIALVLVVLLGAVVFPWVVLTSWSMRTAVVVLALPVGVVCLVRLVVARDRAARWAVAFASVVFTSAVLARAPWFAFLGTAGPHNSVLLYVGAMGCWAIGRSVSSVGRSGLKSTLFAVAVANTLVGTYQAVIGIESGVLAAAGGRSTGLFESSIAYGMLLAGATAACLVHAVRRDGGLWPPIGVVVFSFGCALSGSRIATAVVVVAALIALGIDRRRHSVAALGSVAIGIALATWLGLSTASASTVERTLGRGGDGRLDVWGYGLRAALERPMLGWGPGHHAYAIRRDFSFEFTREHAWADSLSAWSDAHNVVVMLLVTTGVLGLCTASGWILTSLWCSRDRALAAWFLAIAVGWMVEPATVHTLPLALLVLGTAASASRAHPPERAAERRDLAAFVVGALAATAYFVPLVVVHRAIESHDGLRASTAAAWTWRDPLVANLVAERLAIDAQLAAARTEGAGARERRDSLDWSARVTEWAPMSSWAWNSLAFRQIALHDPGAPESLRRVFELDRWNALGWQLQLRWAEDTGDGQLEARSREVVCDLELPACEADQSGS